MGDTVPPSKSWADLDDEEDAKVDFGNSPSSSSTSPTTNQQQQRQWQGEELYAWEGRAILPSLVSSSFELDTWSLRRRKKGAISTTALE
ncbi:hypothetical protein IAT40_002054 [Kwoniella sp. CBS 6097]